MLYVAAVGFVVAFRLGPAAQRLQQQSATVLQEFTESSRRAEHLDDIMTDLWRLLGVTRDGHGPGPLDTLEGHRLNLQALLEAPRGFTTQAWPEGVPLEFRATLISAGVHEGNLGSVMLAAIAAMELGDVPSATAFMKQADTLDAPLAADLANATMLALGNVNRHEALLADTARAAARFVALWMVGGCILFVVVGLFLHRRLYAPLASLDLGLARIAYGDLAVTLSAPNEDELGRLTQHFNRMSALLRQRAAEEEERALLRTAARTRRILEAALDAVVVIDADGIVREWNPQATEVLGWSRTDAVGQNFNELLSPSPGTGEFAVTPSLLEGSTINQRFERLARTRTGALVPVEVAITPLHEAGQGTEYSVFLRDITERQRAQAALAASEARYRGAFEQAAVGMAEVSTEGCYLQVNRAFAAILGTTPDAVVGRRTAEVTHPDDIAGDAEQARQLFEGETAVMQREKRYLRVDGSVAWANITSAMVVSPGAPSFAITVVQDVTDRKLLEEELRQSQKMEAVGRLAGGIAHDFNNLLTAIIGYADMLQEPGVGAQAIHDDAAAIRSAAERGAGLSRNLLAFARNEPLEARPVSLDRVVTEAAALMQRTLDRRIAVRLELSTPPVNVHCDHNQLVNALLNLAINARDAMPGGGTLSFRTYRLLADAPFLARNPRLTLDTEYVGIEVRDTGTGMSNDVLARLFEPFFTTKPPGQGTGLGLAMVYGTVRSHQGHIEVESTMGEGTTITIYLPVHSEAVASPEVALDQPTRGKGHILLVDDEPLIRVVGGRMLERLGYGVTVAADGEEALQKVTDAVTPFDLVIMDGNMPRMTGREACRKIRALRPDLRIVLASGFVDGTTPQELTADGFSEVIQKPYDLNMLSRVVAAQITHQV
ncbi:MAG: PAS domain S-box protein [Gemmatimonadota bacterium]